MTVLALYHVQSNQLGLALQDVKSLDTIEEKKDWPKLHVRDLEVGILGTLKWEVWAAHSVKRNTARKSFVHDAF